MMKRTLTIILTIVVGSLLSGCNTARGMGEDIQSLGHVISRAAS